MAALGQALAMGRLMEPVPVKRKKGMSRMKPGLILILLWTAGCAQHHCRRAPDSPPSPVVAPQGEEVATVATSRKVKVYKYDGSLQCGQGKAADLEAMAKELKGINVFSSKKQSDGLMHIQVCGSPTGMANVYEILEADQPRAERAGFKKWTFE
jgi:hypothetical protein